MRLPALTYRIDDLLPGAALQAVHGADRGVCALTAAFASFARGNKLLGCAKGMTEDAIDRLFESSFRGEMIPLSRARMWRSAVNETRLFVEAPSRDGDGLADAMGGLTPSLYQLAALPRLTIAGGMVAYDPGLGKTLITAIGARAYEVLSYAAPTRCWIIAPLNAMGAWTRYLPELRAIFPDVKVISIDSAHKLVGADRALGGVLIVDEAHNAGHMTARRTKALFQLRPAFDVCIGLTGTLLHVGVEAALTMLDLCIPGAGAFATRWRAGEYFHCLVKKDLGGRSVVKLERPTGPHAQAFLEHMSRYAVVLTQQSEEVRAEAGIPNQHLHTIDMGGAEDEDIDDCIVRLVHQLLEGQPANAPLPHASAVVHAALAEGAEEKWNWILDQIDDPAEGLVLFAEYHTTLDLIEEKLKAGNISYVRVDGSVTGKAREDARERFQAGAVSIFLGQIEAAGESIDLYRGCISVALDHTQKAFKYSQALKRTCRRGQTRECHHFDLIVNPVQAKCLRRLRAGQDFHDDLADYQAALRKATA